MQLMGQGGTSWASAKKQSVVALSSYGWGIMYIELDSHPNRTQQLTSHGLTGAPSIGNPTVVFTANPTTSPALTLAVSGTFLPPFGKRDALRPQRRSRDEGSSSGWM